jgi:hypothetical protein
MAFRKVLSGLKSKVGVKPVARPGGMQRPTPGKPSVVSPVKVAGGGTGVRPTSGAQVRYGSNVRRAVSGAHAGPVGIGVGRASGKSGVVNALAKRLQGRAF